MRSLTSIGSCLIFLLNLFSSLAISRIQRVMVFGEFASKKCVRVCVRVCGGEDGGTASTLVFNNE